MSANSFYIALALKFVDLGLAAARCACPNDSWDSRMDSRSTKNCTSDCEFFAGASTRAHQNGAKTTSVPAPNIVDHGVRSSKSP